MLQQQRQVCISNKSGFNGNDLFDPAASRELLSPFCGFAGHFEAAKAPSLRPPFTASPCWIAQLFPTDKTVDQQEPSCRACHQHFAHSLSNQQWRYRLSGTVRRNQTIGVPLCRLICQQSHLVYFSTPRICLSQAEQLQQAGGAKDPVYSELTWGNYEVMR